MSTIAETSTTQNPPQPLFIECNGAPFLDLDEMPIQIKAPPESDDDDDHSVQCDFESNYDDVIIERKPKAENASINDDLFPGETNYCSLPNKFNDDLLSSGVTIDLLATGIDNYCASKVKEEPCTNIAHVTDPITSHCTSMFGPIEAKNETGLKPSESVSNDVKDAEVPTNSDLKKTPRKKKGKSLSSRAIRPILPKSIVGKNGAIVSIEEIDVQKTQEAVEGVVAEEKQLAKKKRKKSESTPATDTSKDEVELLFESPRSVCPFCHNSYPSEHAMDTHFRKMHKNHYRCKKCQYIYESQDALDEHFQIHETNTALFECPTCHKKYKQIWGLKRHQIRAHSTEEPEPICNESEDHVLCNCESGCRRANRVQPKTYACRYCDNTYPQYFYVVAHERLTHGIQDKGPKKFKCTVCKKCFRSESNLRIHARAHERSFFCDECGKEFREKFLLKSHIRKHTGEKPYQCKVCLTRYAELSVLRVHRLTHTGKRPYVCNICGRSFTQRGSMMIHHRKHPGNHPPPPPVSLASLESVGN